MEHLPPWQILAIAGFGVFCIGVIVGALAVSLVSQAPTVYAKGYHEGYEHGHIEGFHRGRLHESRGAE